MQVNTFRKIRGSVLELTAGETLEAVYKPGAAERVELQVRDRFGIPSHTTRLTIEEAQDLLQDLGEMVMETRGRVQWTRMAKLHQEPDPEHGNPFM